MNAQFWQNLYTKTWKVANDILIYPILPLSTYQGLDAMPTWEVAFLYAESELPVASLYPEKLVRFLMRKTFAEFQFIIVLLSFKNPMTDTVEFSLVILQHDPNGQFNFIYQAANLVQASREATFNFFQAACAKQGINVMRNIVSPTAQHCAPVDSWVCLMSNIETVLFAQGILPKFVSLSETSHPSLTLVKQRYEKMLRPNPIGG